jgi:hypothetical protein
VDALRLLYAYLREMARGLQSIADCCWSSCAVASPKRGRLVSAPVRVLGRSSARHATTRDPARERSDRSTARETHGTVEVCGVWVRCQEEQEVGGEVSSGGREVEGRWSGALGALGVQIAASFGGRVPLRSDTSCG